MDDNLRRAWRDAVLSDEKWSAIPNTAKPSGEAQALFVRSSRDKTGGCLKPTKSSPGRYRAAYEKIAYDLAYEIGVNVPPVLLYHRTDAPHTEEQYTCISLLPTGHFQNLESLLSGASEVRKNLVRFVLRNWSGGIALDAWTDNDDRHNPQNILVALDEAKPVFLLDFSNAFNHGGRWTGGKHSAVRRLAVRAELASTLDRSIEESFLPKIAGLADNMIEDIVCRIPDDFLPKNEKETVKEGIIGRKSKICDNIDLWYPT